MVASGPYGFYPFFYLSWTIAATVVLAGLALTDFPLGEVAASPESTLAYLGARLRYTQTRVAEKPGEVRVQIGGTSIARIQVRPSGAGSRVTFRMDFTPTGLFVVVLLFLLTPLGGLGIPVILAVFAAVRRFARRDVAPLLPAAGPLPARRPDEVQDLLVSGLAEGHRLAAEAYDAERSGYHDAQIIVGIVAIFVWVLVLIVLVTSSTDPDFGGRVVSSLEVSAAAALAVGILAGIAVYQRFAAVLRRFRSSMDALRGAWLREVSRVSPEDSGASSFELLVESSKEVPGWLDAVRRSGLSRDPALGMMLVAVAFWG